MSGELPGNINRSPGWETDVLSEAATRSGPDGRGRGRFRILMAGGAVALVLAIVAVIVVIRVNAGSPAPSPAPTSAPAASGPNTGTLLPASVAAQVTGVPVGTLDAVGGGSVLSSDSTPVSRVSGSPLSSGGKPEMLYIGAEFCPYCAAMRWSMAVALSRFGRLSPLHGIHSSSTDLDPNTPTLTFYGSSYASPYLAFVPVENQTVSHGPLQKPTPAEQAAWNRYDPNSYPFIDFGGKYVISGAMYDPAVLAGQTWAGVAAALHDPSSPIAQGALGAANLMTAAICGLTGGQPGSVCSSSTIKGLETRL